MLRIDARQRQCLELTAQLVLLVMLDDDALAVAEEVGLITRCVESLPVHRNIHPPTTVLTMVAPARKKVYDQGRGAQLRTVVRADAVSSTYCFLA